MDLAAVPWWIGAIATPIAVSASGAAAYIWKQRERAQAAERALAVTRENEERAATAARIATLEAALRQAHADRFADHVEHRDKLLALYQGAIDSEGDLREAVRSVSAMPAVVREALETVTTSLRLAFREELDRASVTPPAPKRGPAR